MDYPALLEPYIIGLTATQIAQVSTYLDLLLRWNAKTNLTSIRDPQQIVKRHFGESFFLARQLFSPVANGPDAATEPIVITRPNEERPRDLLSALQLPITNYKLQILDLGSGAGFPAIPLKIACPDLTLTLVEAHHTKAVFLREVLRALELNAEVKNIRAEQLPPGSASLVTLRAVERFDSILPIAAHLVCVRKQEKTEMEAARPRAAEDTEPVWKRTPSPVQAMRSIADERLVSEPGSVHCPPSTVHGLALLISTSQIADARKILPNWRFRPEIPIPNSQNRVVQLVEPNQ